MPFDLRGLTALNQANGFTLWHYRTADARAAVLAAGYFAAAAGRLRAGDLLIVQAADATALVPIRADGAAASGVTLDAASAGLALTRSATQMFTVTQAGSAVARAIVLAPLPGVATIGGTIAVSASVTGPVAAVAFSLLSEAGTPVQPTQTVAVTGGVAVASFATPAAGGGYRIRAADAEDPTLFTRSPPFAAALPPRLLLEAGGRLLIEQGGALRL